MAPNQMDVAREAGVSGATVSRVINDLPSVTEETKERVRSAMERLRYTPNAAARQLARQRSDTIGVVITKIASGFFASVMNGISTAAQTRGYTTVFVVATIEDRGRSIYRKMLEGGRADGLIILEPWLSDERIAEIEAINRPVVLIQRDVKSERIGSVAIDNRHGAIMGMEHLLSCGYDNVLVLTGPPETQDAQEREEGCKQVVRGAKNKNVMVQYVRGFFHPERAVEAFRDFVAKHGLPRAVFAHNDAMAVAILTELHRSGVKVPEQVAVMGFDGIEAAEYFDLTTIATPVTEMGERAVEMLHAKLQDPTSKAQHIRLEGRLVLRQSS